MKMGAIIRLECFIKTKNPEIQYKISLSVGYEYNALFSFVTIGSPMLWLQGNNTTIQCLARAQAGNHNIGLPML
jgi:hypothetical protein